MSPGRNAQCSWLWHRQWLWLCRQKTVQMHGQSPWRYMCRTRLSLSLKPAKARHTFLMLPFPQLLASLLALFWSQFVP